MDLNLYLRVIWRFRFLVLVGVVLAVVLVLYLVLGPRDRANTGVAQRSDAPQTRMTTPSNPTTPAPNAPTTK